MPVFNIYGRVVGSKYLGKLEADSESAAIDKAYNEFDCEVDLCHQCVDECEDAQIESVVATQAEEGVTVDDEER